MHMLNRQDTGHSFSYNERVRHYHHLLSFYISLIENHEPAFVVFQTHPHGVPSYLLYAVATEHNIPTYMFETNRVPDTCFIITQIHETPEPLVSTYERLKDQQRQPDLEPRIEEYLSRVQADPETAKHEAWGVKKEMKPYVKMVKTVLSIPLTVLRNDTRESPRSLKERRKPIEESNIRDVPFKLYDIFTARYNQALRDAYAAVSKPADFDQTYIYVPLHYQPERSVIPKGGAYKNQLLVVELLAKTVPDDWQIYVKEHPRQFNSRDSHQGRLQELYGDLAELESVTVVEAETASIRLTDGAVAVATLTGTAGWEGIIRNTPALLFGSAWYEACDGTFQVQTAEDVTAAIERIDSGSGVEINLDDIRRFIKALKTVGFAGSPYPYKPSEDISAAENRDNMFECLRSQILADSRPE